jgi:hypothetical protein
LWRTEKQQAGTAEIVIVLMISNPCPLLTTQNSLSQSFFLVLSVVRGRFDTTSPDLWDFIDSPSTQTLTMDDLKFDGVVKKSILLAE